MRFLRHSLYALFWMAIGLGLGLFPLGGSTVWERLSPSLPLSGKTAADKEARRPLGNYTAEEKALIDKLVRGGS
jgi:hypothetical protein